MLCWANWPLYGIKLKDESFRLGNQIHMRKVRNGYHRHPFDAHDLPVAWIPLPIAPIDEWEIDPEMFAAVTTWIGQLHMKNELKHNDDNSRDMREPKQWLNLSRLMDDGAEVAGARRATWSTNLELILHRTDSLSPPTADRFVWKADRRWVGACFCSCS